MEGLCSIFQEARIKQKVFNWNSKQSISILFIFVLTGNSVVRYEYLYSKQCLFAKVRTNCMKLERLYVPNNIKIILQIGIFVIWLTDFLSDIRNLINPPWRFEQILLSMKRCENSCKDVSHSDDCSLLTCGRRTEKLLSDWFSGHCRYWVLNSCIYLATKRYCGGFCTGL